MAIFAADLAAIGLAKNVENAAKRRGLFAVQAAGDEFAIEVPDGQAEIFEIELGRVMRRHVERIDVSEQMAANAIRVDQLQNIGLFLGLFAERSPPKRGRIVILGPAERRIIDLEIGEDAVVKTMLADEEFVDPREKQPALGALDDAVIIGAGDRDRLADAELRKSAGGHRLILGRILDRSGRDDRALAGHQPRVRGDGADRARDLSARSSCPESRRSRACRRGPF